jgi:hypothetical protein
VKESMRNAIRERPCQVALSEGKTQGSGEGAKDANSTKKKLSKSFEGMTYRANNQRAIYLVKDGVLRAVPDMPTFESLKLDLSLVNVVEPSELDRMIIGDPLPGSS